MVLPTSRHPRSHCEVMEREEQKVASAYFHDEEHNWNCAQSVLKAHQEHCAITDEELELHYRSKGGGRAEGGLCGAIYAATHLAPEAMRPSLLESFEARAGALTCARLKGKCGRSCRELVDIADEELRLALQTDEI